MTTQGFNDDWGLRRNSFKVSPPNAALEILGGSHEGDVVLVTISSPQYDAERNQLTYRAQVLKDRSRALQVFDSRADAITKIPDTFGTAALFIDPGTSAADIAAVAQSAAATTVAKVEAANSTQVALATCGTPNHPACPTPTATPFNLIGTLEACQSTLSNATPVGCPTSSASWAPTPTVKPLSQSENATVMAGVCGGFNKPCSTNGTVPTSTPTPTLINQVAQETKDDFNRCLHDPTKC